MKRCQAAFVQRAVLLLAALAGFGVNAQGFRSHPPSRPLPLPSARPLADGPAYFVDPARGDDQAAGSRQNPWRTIQQALPRLRPGDTLVLRGGAYFERLYCAIAGTPEQPITIRSHPGELAVINGGFAEFQTRPETAWEPVSDGVPGEYRSTRAYKNIRDVVGLFGDSLIGLQTYWYRTDMQAENELWISHPEKFVEPVYCGPGLWYDKQSGRIHARLAHTKLTLPESAGHTLPQYRGETDPRKLPLVVAPFNSVPLFIDQAMHVRFEDLAFRGGGLATVRLAFGVSITFDGCTIHAANTGVMAKGAGPLKMVNCGVFGMIAPWMFRTENALYAYSAKVYPPFLDGEAVTEIAGSTNARPRRVSRHISRLPTHALLVTDGGFEFETFYYPLNHDWEIANCEFTEGHDGVYLSGRDIRFHHNLVDNIQDDGIYVSSPTPYINDGLYIHENLVRQAVDGFGGHARGGPGGKIYIYRNVVDLRHPLQFGRPTDKRPAGSIFPGHSAWLVHNPDHIISMEDICFYHNTTLTPMGHVHGGYSAGMPFHFFPEAERRVFNNLHVYIGGAKRYPVAFGYKRDRGNVVLDANLHWHADPSVKVPKDYFKTSREHVMSLANKDRYPAGWDAHSLAADPKFQSFTTNTLEAVDLRLTPGSPARAAGVALPADWPDTVAAKAGARPDIGAIPFGGGQLKVGINGRVTVGEVRKY